MATYEIPLTAQPQEFRITLGGVEYVMALLWNPDGASWTINIADTNEVPLVNGIPLLADVDLLAPYPHLAFGGQLIARTARAPGVSPTFENLGSSGRVYFITP